MMKTAEEVEKAFSVFSSECIPFGSTVRIILQRGLRTKYIDRDLYGHERKIIVVEPERQHRQSKRQLRLIGVYEDSRDLDDYNELLEDPLIEFTVQGYELLVKCSEIADYKVIRRGKG